MSSTVAKLVIFQKPKLIRVAPASGNERHDQQPLMKTRLLLLLVEAGKYLKLPLELAGEAKISFEGSWKDVH